MTVALIQAAFNGHVAENPAFIWIPAILQHVSNHCCLFLLVPELGRIVVAEDNEVPAILSPYKQGDAISTEKMTVSQAIPQRLLAVGAEIKEYKYNKESGEDRKNGLMSCFSRWNRRQFSRQLKGAGARFPPVTIRLRLVKSPETEQQSCHINGCSKYQDAAQQNHHIEPERREGVACTAFAHQQPRPYKGQGNGVDNEEKNAFHEVSSSPCVLSTLLWRGCRRNSNCRSHLY